MALSPFTDTADLIEEVSTDDVMLPTLTYQFDFDKQEFTGALIDGQEAVIQAARLILITPRFHYLIFTEYYGNELEDLIGEDVSSDFLDSEIPRYITESLIYDERILAVSNIVLTLDASDDKLYISFLLETIYGDTELEEEINV